MTETPTLDRAGLKLQPYHLFDYGGASYIVNVNRKFSRPADPELTRALGEPGEVDVQSLPETLFAKLKGLGLIDEDKPRKEQPQPAEPPVHRISLFAAQVCNLSCGYCYGIGGEYGNKGLLKEDVAFRSVDWLIAKSKDLKEISISFFGGEPMINFPIMKRVVEYAKEQAAAAGKKVQFLVTTNATLLDDERIAYLKQEGFSVTVSFDGPAEVQDRNRPFRNGTQSSYEVARANIEKLLVAIPHALCRSTLTGETDPGTVTGAVKEVGFTNYALSEASGVALPGQVKPHLPPSRENLVRFYEQEVVEIFAAVKARDLERMRDLKNSAVIGALVKNRKGKQNHFCGAGKSYLAVSTKGDVYPCHRFVGMEDYRIGSVNEPALRQKEFTRSAVESNPTCSACWAKHYCGGGCYYDHTAHSGSVSAPNEDECDLIRFRIKLAIHLALQLQREDITWLEEHRIIPKQPWYLDLLT